MNYLIDSCILIDHLRGNKNIDFLKKDRRNHLKISIITMMELILGARNEPTARQATRYQLSFVSIRLVKQN